MCDIYQLVERDRDDSVPLFLKEEGEGRFVLAGYELVFALLAESCYIYRLKETSFITYLLVRRDSGSAGVAK